MLAPKACGQKAQPRHVLARIAALPVNEIDEFATLGHRGPDSFRVTPRLSKRRHPPSNQALTLLPQPRRSDRLMIQPTGHGGVSSYATSTVQRETAAMTLTRVQIAASQSCRDAEPQRTSKGLLARDNIPIMYRAVKVDNSKPDPLTEGFSGSTEFHAVQPMIGSAGRTTIVSGSFEGVKNFAEHESDCALYAICGTGLWAVSLRENIDDDDSRNVIYQFSETGDEDFEGAIDFDEVHVLNEIEPERVVRLFASNEHWREISPEVLKQLTNRLERWSRHQGEPLPPEMRAIPTLDSPQVLLSTITSRNVADNESRDVERIKKSIDVKQDNISRYKYTLSKDDLRQLAYEVNHTLAHYSANCTLLSACLHFNIRHRQGILRARNLTSPLEGLDEHIVDQVIFGHKLQSSHILQSLEEVQAEILRRYNNGDGDSFIISAENYIIPIAGASGHDFNAVVLRGKDGSTHVQFVDPWKTSESLPTFDQLKKRFSASAKFFIRSDAEQKIDLPQWQPGRSAPRQIPMAATSKNPFGASANYPSSLKDQLSTKSVALQEMRYGKDTLKYARLWQTDDLCAVDSVVQCLTALAARDGFERAIPDSAENIYLIRCTDPEWVAEGKITNNPGSMADIYDNYHLIEWRKYPSPTLKGKGICADHLPHGGINFIIGLSPSKANPHEREGHKRVACSLADIFNCSGRIYRDTGGDIDTVIVELPQGKSISDRLPEYLNRLPPSRGNAPPPAYPSGSEGYPAIHSGPDDRHHATDLAIEEAVETSAGISSEKTRLKDWENLLLRKDVAGNPSFPYKDAVSLISQLLQIQQDPKVANCISALRREDKYRGNEIQYELRNSPLINTRFLYLTTLQSFLAKDASQEAADLVAQLLYRRQGRIKDQAGLKTAMNRTLKWTMGSCWTGPARRYFESLHWYKPRLPDLDLVGSEAVGAYLDILRTLEKRCSPSVKNTYLKEMNDRSEAQNDNIGRYIDQNRSGIPFDKNQEIYAERMLYNEAVQLAREREHDAKIRAINRTLPAGLSPISGLSRKMVTESNFEAILNICKNNSNIVVEHKLSLLGIDVSQQDFEFSHSDNKEIDSILNSSRAAQIIDRAIEDATNPVGQLSIDKKKATDQAVNNLVPLILTNDAISKSISTFSDYHEKHEAFVFNRISSLQRENPEVAENLAYLEKYKDNSSHPDKRARNFSEVGFPEKVTGAAKLHLEKRTLTLATAKVEKAAKFLAEERLRMETEARLAAEAEKRIREMADKRLGEQLKERVEERLAPRVQEKVAERVLPRVQEEIAERLAPKMQEKVAERVLPRVQEEIAERLAPRMQEKVAERVLPRVQEEIAERLAPRMQEKIAERVAPRVEEKVDERTAQIDKEIEAARRNGTLITLRLVDPNDRDREPKSHATPSLAEDEDLPYSYFSRNRGMDAGPQRYG
ncbi:T3SS effector cysteine hydrolase SpvD family protein [Achromobacter xylosoxidans]|uniref:T3SS effector cysteine hydrolase SpvD family protein n=1 Tax=Alcaligenes xylosoxydans xylosoxydans TaxID=85698 RepID=UPI00192CA497|nr:T3SS effector cysteine hydrolase SpvD family protein [Achromobacter xylosoxidans]